MQYHWGKLNRDDSISLNEASLWRYWAVLPSVVENQRVSLGEGWTPLTKIQGTEEKVLIKDETVNPTGSFKDRGMALAITMAEQQGIKAVCLPSAGNAGVAAAAYTHTAGIGCHVFLPESIPASYVEMTKHYGAVVHLHGQNIAEAADKMKQEQSIDWFDLSTLKEPFRIEGKKTLGYEIVEQLDWKFPDVIVYPTGGGTGLIGMWKAFRELIELEWVTGKLPRMVVAQSDGCAPVVKAFEQGKSRTEKWEHNFTMALGLNVPGPLGGKWILDTLRASNGLAVSVKETKIKAATKHFRRVTGIPASEEAGVVWLAYQTLLKNNWIKNGEQIILFATGIRRL